MRTTLRWWTAAAVALGATVACGGGGGGDGGGGPNNGGGEISAKIDGVDFTNNQFAVQAGSPGIPGSMLVTATRVDGSTTTTIQFILGYVRFPAIYPLGVNQGTTPGGSATLIHTTSNAAETRLTPLDGQSGTFQIVSRTGNHITGTFSFVAQPLAGTTTVGNRTVSNGTFDFDLPDGFTEVGTTNYGSEVMATLDGNKYYAATVVGLGANGGYSMAGQTLTRSLQILNSTVINSPGTLNFLSGVTVTLIDVPSGHSWGGIAGDSGKVTFSGVGARAIGTFSGRLGANFQGGSPITITNGSFNVRIDAP